ncbi:MAG: hypothetical protein IJ896_02460 [Fibrobacter sp.]|nr:hypothetical protein [Fibrobacter sp.]
METPVIPEDGDGVITLQLQTSELQTRADGDEEVNVENVVKHADFFFFKDEEGTQLIDHVRKNVAEGELVAVSDNLYEYTFDVRTDTHDGPLQGPSYVYVIANYPEAITAETLEDILALDIKTDLSKKIEYFVMDSYDSSSEEYMKYISPSKAGDSKTFKIGLTRTAAKLVLKFNVADSYTDDFNNTWTPVTDQMWVNFVNALKSAVVEATPVEFTTVKTDYFTTDQVAPTSTTSAKEDYTSWTTEAVYTYPQAFSTSDNKAPYFKLYCPWTCTSKGMNNFYYKIILPQLETFKRNTIYTLTVDVSAPGGTEDDWALVADYIYVANWFEPTAVAAEFESALYLDVPVKEYTIYGIDDISVPVVSSNDIEIVSCVGTQKTVQGGTKNPRAVTLNSKPNTGNYCVATGSELFDLHYELDPDITVTHNETFDCTPIEWTVTIRHKATTDGEPYLDDKTVTVKITQYPSIYAELIEGGNSFINGYYALQTASVYNAPSSEHHNGDYYRWRNSGDLFSSPNNSETGSYGRLNQTTTSDKGTTMTIVTVTAFAPSSSSYSVYSNGTTSGQPGSGNKTDFEYIIGDPRVPWNELFEEGHRDLNPYLWGGTGQGTNASPAHTEAWENVDKIMVTGRDKNIIAPAYMFNSDRGGRPGNNGVVYENAAKRCATYQEAGYPAGRWRLPTEAELYFAYCLQHMDVIPHLFNGGAGYHASSGNVFDWTNNGNGTTFQAPGNDVHSIRCVYDIWYWGEEPAVTGDDVHRFYPGTLNN